MYVKKRTFLTLLILIAGLMQAQSADKYGQRKLSQHKEVAHKTKGHSHNDYKQASPFSVAYNAGMESIEADVFLQNDTLYVAHEKKEIAPLRTLDSLYLRPLATLYKQNGDHSFTDKTKKLQLVIDIKENYQQTIPAIIKRLAAYQTIFNTSLNPDAVKIVLSGDLPNPEEFDEYPMHIYFDGRPNIDYGNALFRVAMISQDIKKYTLWDGEGTPNPHDKEVLTKVVQAAHKLGKPFRFWATHDSPNTWSELEKIGVDWINTDHPDELRKYYDNFK